jgi:hypothetical protein
MAHFGELSVTPTQLADQIVDMLNSGIGV